MQKELVMSKSHSQNHQAQSQTQSMTGFGRAEANLGTRQLTWEIRSVNNKGLDVRLRMPTDLLHLENEARKLITSRVGRGSLQVSLSISNSEQVVVPVLNKETLATFVDISKQISTEIGGGSISIDHLMSMKGIIEYREPERSDEEQKLIENTCMAVLEACLDDVIARRNIEGAALQKTLSKQMQSAQVLIEKIDSDPSRNVETIREKLSAQVKLLTAEASNLDEGRVYAEAALLATKSDLREELDRLYAHVQAVKDLLAAGGLIGRRLDFLAQEFNREANTICSKSNASTVTALGLELKVIIDQMREQVQNLE